MEKTLVKPYFCIYYDTDEQQWEEEYFDKLLEAMTCAHSCDLSEFRYHWGNTQGKG